MCRVHILFWYAGDKIIDSVVFVNHRVLLCCISLFVNSVFSLFWYLLCCSLSLSLFLRAATSSVQAARRSLARARALSRSQHPAVRAAPMAGRPAVTVAPPSTPLTISVANDLAQRRQAPVERVQPVAAAMYDDSDLERDQTALVSAKLLCACCSQTVQETTAWQQQSINFVLLVMKKSNPLEYALLCCTPYPVSKWCSV